MKTRLLVIAALVLAAPPALAATGHGIDTAIMDKSVAPGDDFFAYATGTWTKDTQIPADQAGWGAFSVLRELANKRTAELIEDAAKENPAPGSEKAKIGDFYASYMDEAGIEAKGLAPLKPELAAIGAIKNKKELARAIGSATRADVDALNNTNFYTENLFGVWVAPGFADSAHYTPYLMQGGLGIPSRDYYLTDNPKMAAVRDAYKAHIATVLKLAGFTDAGAKAQAIFDLEMKIAAAQESIVDSQDVVKANNPWARGDFTRKAPGLDWDAFFAGAGLSKTQGFIVWQPRAFTGIAKLVSDAPLDTWKAYLAFHRINHFSAYLPKAFSDERFAFYGKTLSGTPQQRDRWKRAVDVTNAAMGDAIGKLYAAKYFSPVAKARAQAMVKNIIAAWGKRIDALDWMTPETKAKAKEKLFALYVGIGYPETWRDYSGLTVVKGDAIGNAERSELFDYHRSISRIGAPVDEHEWSMEPQTVNAVNLPLQNALNFPAAILERPFFDAGANDAYNYGAIGSVIGHEISHTFDNQGAEFDAHGRLFNWWTKADFTHFEASGDALVAQFSAYKPFPDLAVNGRQTLGENIADLAGLSASYDAWRVSLGGNPAPPDQSFTGDQQFFLAYDQSREQKSRDAALRQQVLTDVHAPAMYRALTVRNLDAWYPAFDVKPGQKLYLAPKDRVRVW
ncbi:MAG TPA: M13 family metallopeptidase [Rhizomicrobium sp.]|jgi:predicted metalloendopeptidase|nr:M13 family metallopeptidase [Rhizomicrobium sp.]